MMKLHEQVSHVQSKDDLVAFVRALSQDLATNCGSWENQTLDSYLSALASWLEDSEGFYKNQGRPVPQTPTWRDIADMLMAAKMYE